MTGWKSFIKSKGVWGPLVAILVLLANAVFNVDIGTETQEEITNLIVTLGGVVASAVGLYGRVVAKDRIKVPGKTDER